MSLFDSSEYELRLESKIKELKNTISTLETDITKLEKHITDLNDKAHMVSMGIRKTVEEINACIPGAAYIGCDRVGIDIEKLTRTISEETKLKIEKALEALALREKQMSWREADARLKIDKDLNHCKKLCIERYQKSKQLLADAESIKEQQMIAASKDKTLLAVAGIMEQGHHALQRAKSEFRARQEQFISEMDSYKAAFANSVGLQVPLLKRKCKHNPVPQEGEPAFNIVYRVHFPTIGKEYIGKHSTNNLADNYWGSGSDVKALDDIHKQQAIVEVLYYGSSRKEAFIMESLMLTDYYLNSPKTLNNKRGLILDKQDQEIVQKMKVAAQLDVFKTTDIIPVDVILPGKTEIERTVDRVTSTHAVSKLFANIWTINDSLIPMEELEQHEYWADCIKLIN